MSYFMTISGELPLQSFPPLEFLPISKGQRYVANLEAEFAAADGSPVWFVHDGQTGTSHAFVSDARDYYGGSGNIDGTQLLLLIKACIDADCGFRIWWPTHKPGGTGGTRRVYHYRRTPGSARPTLRRGLGCLPAPEENR